MIKMDHDTALEPMTHRRRIHTTESIAFWVAVDMLCVLPLIHTENMDILSGFHRGGKKCIDPKAREAGLRIQMLEEIVKIREQEMRSDEKHVEAYRTPKERVTMTCFTMFVKKDPLTKKGGDLHGGATTTIKATTVKQERTKQYVVIFFVR